MYYYLFGVLLPYYPKFAKNLVIARPHGQNTGEGYGVSSSVHSASPKMYYCHVTVKRQMKLLVVHDALVNHLALVKKKFW